MTREEAINLVKQVLPCLNIDEKIREGFETLIPELKESEDERIRKIMLGALRLRRDDGEEFFGSVRIEKCIAYLEKQKDAFENGRQLGIMQEQARQELEWTDERQKEQKPAEYGDDVVEEAEEYTSKVKCGDYGVEVTEAYIAGVLAERNRKPADDKAFEFEKTKAKYEGIVEWKQTVLGHPEEYGLQKPAEWKKATINGEPISTENQSVDILLAKWSEKCGVEECGLYSTERKIEPEPKVEWNEEDKEMLNTIIADVSRMLHSCGIGTDEWNIRSKAIHFLKSIRPSWKPSEEQMEYLEWWRTFIHPATPAGEALESLYNDLKKLI